MLSLREFRLSLVKAKELITRRADLPSSSRVSEEHNSEFKRLSEEAARLGGENPLDSTTFSSPDFILSAQKTLQTVLLEKLNPLSTLLDQKNYSYLKGVINDENMIFSPSETFSILTSNTSEDDKDTITERVTKIRSGLPVNLSETKDEKEEIKNMYSVVLSSKLIRQSIKLSEDTIESYRGFLSGTKNLDDVFSEELTNPPAFKTSTPEYGEDTHSPENPHTSPQKRKS